MKFGQRPPPSGRCWIYDLQGMPSKRDELEFTDVNNAYIREGGDVRVRDERDVAIAAQWLFRLKNGVPVH